MNEKKNWWRVLGGVAGAVLGCAVAAVGAENPLTAEGRNYFYENERIALTVPASGDNVEVKFVNATGIKRAVTVPVQSGFAQFQLEPLALSPGQWSIEAGGTKGAITIASSIRGTPYTFLNYQGWVDDAVPLWGEWMKPVTSEQRVQQWRDDYGINMLQLQNGGIPTTPRTQDLLIQMGARFSTLSTMAGQHQPSGGLFDWSMPEVLVATRRQAQHAAQVLRRYPGFIGVHYADEPGLTYGTRNPDGTFEPYNGTVPDQKTHYFGPLAVPAQFALYTQKTGKPLPDVFNPQANLEPWLDYMRFRTTILGDAFSQYTRDVHKIDPRLIGYSQLYAWMFLSDGEYPPENTKGVDVISSHAYIDFALGLWYPVHESDAMRDGDWGKPLWMMPSFEGMIRMPTIYASISRKLEGLGWDRTTALTVPETKLLAQRIVPISGMLYDVSKPRDPVAVFYSRDQYLVEMSKNIKNHYQGRDYASRLGAAWIMSNAAQCPAVRVVEEDLINGLAKEHKVIIAPQLTYARPQIKAALEKFVRDGGTLLMDQTATLEIPGATKLPFSFVDWGAQATAGSPGFENLTQGQIFDKYIVPNLPAFKEAIAGKVTPLVHAADPWLLASQQLAQGGQYVWLVNMKHSTRDTFLPLSTSVTLPKAPAIYDVFARKLIPSETIELNLAGGDAAVYAIMPSKVETVKIEAQPAVGTVKLLASVSGAAGPVDAIIPLSFELRDPSGNLVKKFYRATSHGRFEEVLSLGNAPAAGEYSIHIQELLSNQQATVKFAPQLASGIFAATATVDVFDDDHILSTLKENKGKKMLVLYGTEAQKPIAQKVADLVQQQGGDPILAPASKYDVLREGRVPSLFYTAGIYTDPVDIPHAAVLIGSEKDNPLTKRVVAALLVPRPISEKYPGSGRGMVYWARSILGLDKDLVMIYANDAKGLERALEAFEQTVKTGKAPVDRAWSQNGDNAAESKLK